MSRGASELPQAQLGLCPRFPTTWEFVMPILLNEEKSVALTISLSFRAVLNRENQICRTVRRVCACPAVAVKNRLYRSFILILDVIHPNL